MLCDPFALCSDLESAKNFRHDHLQIFRTHVDKSSKYFDKRFNKCSIKFNAGNLGAGHCILAKIMKMLNMQNAGRARDCSLCDEYSH